jgi:hypothetical protein
VVEVVEAAAVVAVDVELEVVVILMSVLLGRNQTAPNLELR